MMDGDTFWAGLISALGAVNTLVSHLPQITKPPKPERKIYASFLIGQIRERLDELEAHFGKDS